mgnify:CR=1 FL=1
MALSCTYAAAPPNPPRAMSLSAFHPAVAAWFEAAFSAPTPVQTAAWRAIAADRDALIAAPTGSGKTLAAFLGVIDALVREGLSGDLPDATRVVYVSPLKALSNDIERNLQAPLAGIAAALAAQGMAPPDIRVHVRTGDTSQGAREAMRKHAPHILVTTPESLYLLLTSESGRRMLAGARSVIVDEIHAVAESKRGAHLALSLERLAALCPRPLQRIGLSATQKPLSEVAQFLLGAKPLAGCDIVDVGHTRARDLALELPPSPLEAVMSHEVWDQVYDRIAQLAREHKTTLVFVNTRRHAERVTRHLSERLGESAVAAHHGSLSKDKRFDAEQRLKSGALQCLVATASLELGIDIGDVELVCQIASPRRINTFLQRVGRANHAVGGTPKGRLFPLSRDELIECTALLAAVRAGALDRLHIPPHPLDVLAQQIVAEVAAQDYSEDALYALVTRAYPYRALDRTTFDRIVRMLSDGFSTRRGRRATYLHRDAVNRDLRARRGARLVALTSGGAIPDNADYQVILEPAGTFIGTLNEDFAVESLAGDIFQLGNNSFRILRVESGRVRVEDAHGQPPSIPFWLGEAPARSDELSQAVSDFRAELNRRIESLEPDALARVADDVARDYAIPSMAATQLVDYLAAAKAMLETLPTQACVVLERFFDESGGMQLVLHAPFGARINRAWGLALRKRFCRQFNFELQAAATDDAIVLSLSESHSFPLAEVAKYLHSASAGDVLIQALLDAPLFITRWRWNANIALAVPRFRGGKKLPAPLQRMESEDLMAAVFPDQIACAENLSGPREVPEHPLVDQTLWDSLHDAMDVDGFLRVLRGLETGDIRLLARDLPQPSPLAHEILNARPYAFLDDAPLEERRTQAVMSRRWLDPQTAADFGALDSEAIARVREEIWPAPEHADEVHDALLLLGCLTDSEAAPWSDWLAELSAARRAARLQIADSLWVAAEQLPWFDAVYHNPARAPHIDAPAEYRKDWPRDAALVEILRARLQGLGPTTVAALAQTLALAGADIEHALLALEGEGFAMRGRFTPGAATEEWCERRLLARIHRYTVQRLRAEIEPINSADCMRFLCEWQGVTREPRAEGAQALFALVQQLEGFDAPAVAWEGDILPARLQDYDPQWLDQLCLAGRVQWLRRTPGQGARSGPIRSTPVAILSRAQAAVWIPPLSGDAALSSNAQRLLADLDAHGASFFDDLIARTQLLRAQAEDALGELVAAGLAHSDSFSGLRALLMPADKKRALASRRRRAAVFGIEEAGRWGRVRRDANAKDVEAIARTLLKRYGVVFRKLLTREADTLPPWYELLRVYRRLEARGEIRGGRFVAGFAGEQYALPDAVNAMRAVRKRARSDTFVSLSAADPLNLAGILTPGARVPALAGNRILLRDGVPVAVHIGGETRWLETLAPEAEWAARQALLRRRLAPGVRGYAS